MLQPHDLSRSLTPFVQDNTLVAVIELSLSSWLVAGAVPGVARQPLKKLDPDETELLRLLRRWRDEAVRGGCPIERIVVAYEAGRDGFWLARWLHVQEIETYVIHSTSAAVSREHRRAKTRIPRLKVFGSPLALKNQGDSLSLQITDHHQRDTECCHKACWSSSMKRSGRAAG